MHTSTQAAAKLTKNQSLVLAALERSEGPKSAYSILDDLRDEGFRAPLQVYRALEKLIALGLIHRLESLNAFVACRHPHCEAQEMIAFTICDTCGEVTELSDQNLTRRLKAIVKDAHFALQKSTLELRGICQTCQSS